MKKRKRARGQTEKDSKGLRNRKESKKCRRKTRKNNKNKSRECGCV